MALAPQQALFTAVRAALLVSYPGAVHDGAIPGEETPYPFIYLEGFDQRDKQNKSLIMGYIPVIIHVWHNRPDRRGTVSAMVEDVKTALRSATCNDYSFQARNVMSDIKTDNTTAAPLMHGIVQAEVYFSPKH